MMLLLFGTTSNVFGLMGKGLLVSLLRLTWVLAVESLECEWPEKSLALIADCLRDR